MKLLFSALFSLLFILATSCKKDKGKNNNLGLVTTPSTNLSPDACTIYPEARILSLSGPSTVSVNQDAQFQIRFRVSDGCGSLGGFQTDNNNDTLAVKVIAKYLTCAVCTQAIVTITSSYSVRASQAGVYYLKFLKEDGTQLIKAVTVQ